MIRINFVFLMNDNFSSQAAAYAQYRPQYPEGLFEYIIGFVKHPKLAWDCGTGNGQAATKISTYFERVYATDISRQQISHAIPKSNILYAIEPAERTTLEDNTVELVTVSQALHWFDLDKFYKEVKRVSEPAGLIAAWTYSLIQIDPATDPLIHHYHNRILENYWDAARSHVNDGYQRIDFPFTQIKTPVFSIVVHWGLQELEGYLNT